MKSKLLVRGLLTTMTTLLIAGCASPKEKPRVLSEVPANSFVETAQLTLSKESGRGTAVYALPSLLVVRTDRNRLLALSDGLQIRFTKRLDLDQDNTRVPVLAGPNLVVPGDAALYYYPLDGRPDGMTRLPFPLTSDLASGDGTRLIAGVAAPTGGRLATIDLFDTVAPIRTDVYLGTIAARPVRFRDLSYAATTDGGLFAVGADNQSGWNLPQGRFDIDRGVSAPLVADDYALFVASLDTKLYAIDRVSGKIRWRYFGSAPLQESPVVTVDRVYQHVPNRGLVAIDKVSGDLSRQPLWIASSAKKILGYDEKFVYVVSDRNQLQALRKADGSVAFQTSRRDMKLFASSVNDKGQPQFFAVTSRGVVLAIRPQLQAGTSGYIVVSPQQSPLAAAQ